MYRLIFYISFIWLGKIFWSSEFSTWEFVLYIFYLEYLWKFSGPEKWSAAGMLKMTKVFSRQSDPVARTFYEKVSGAQEGFIDGTALQ